MPDKRIIHPARLGPDGQIEGALVKDGEAIYTLRITDEELRQLLKRRQ